MQNVEVPQNYRFLKFCYKLPCESDLKITNFVDLSIKAFKGQETLQKIFITLSRFWLLREWGEVWVNPLKSEKIC